MDVQIHHFDLNTLQVEHHNRRHQSTVYLEHMLVDNCAMQLVHDPAQFDVILTENMFGDILSDEASMITGSIGMLSSASLNDTKFGLYEPSHGSAPDIAGKGLANPLACIMNGVMMLQHIHENKAAEKIEKAYNAVLEEGNPEVLTRDIGGTGSMKSFVDAILKKLYFFK